jgi:hypothetical protein
MCPRTSAPVFGWRCGTDAAIELITEAAYGDLVAALHATGLPRASRLQQVDAATMKDSPAG